MSDVLAAFRELSQNWDQIQASQMCGCCECLQIFPRDDIVAWTGLDMHNYEDPAAISKQTALCPRCGGESVIGDKSGYPINPQFLERMNDAWFQRTMIRRAPPRP
ncbi:MAG TPA: hypothetical protein PLF63_13790 [Rubrivivax sp.]|jgi:hypothetical protein|nr:hypothetical protein [Rubrivivax sp.]